jgi:hypothetical protein
LRVLWALADPELNAYVGSSGTHGTAWPHLQQICRIERHRLSVRRGRVVDAEMEVHYSVTSAKGLLGAIRGHWGIENRLHYVRDVSFAEDRCQVRGGAAPQVLAACRNLAIALLRQTGVTNIAAGLRTYAARPAAATRLVITPASEW